MTTPQIVAIVGGTGAAGYGLALRLATAGLEVIIGSRDVEKAERTAAQAGLPNLRGMANKEAAAAGSIVFLTVPFEAQVDTIKSIASVLDNKVLVDVTVPLATAVGGRPTRILGVWQGSAAEQARELAPKTAAVVASFHHVSSAALRQIGKPLDCDILFCGDSDQAKEQLSELIRKIPGARPVNAGPLENARTLEAMTALLIHINRIYKGHTAGIRITGI